MLPLPLISTVRAGYGYTGGAAAQLERETGLASSSAQFGRLYDAMSRFGTGASGAVILNGTTLCG